VEGAVCANLHARTETEIKAIRRGFIFPGAGGYNIFRPSDVKADNRNTAASTEWFRPVLGIGPKCSTSSTPLVEGNVHCRANNSLSLLPIRRQKTTAIKPRSML
jgi:hypothetical protein